MFEMVAVMLGGSFGALSRYLLSEYINKTVGLSFPVGTLFVNTLGSFIVAVFTVLAVERLAIDPLVRLFFAVGFLGAFTTFSTFSYETVSLLQNGEIPKALINILLNNFLSITGAVLGVVLARSF